MSNVSRAEHLAWCKNRAMEYIDSGDLNGAFTSFASDVAKHPETVEIKLSIAMLGFPLLTSGFLKTAAEMKKHINGYN